ncbi:MAG: DNA helicase UvrD [Candidatus Thiodiazotropha sp. (ex Lucina pensylvanica)]|nr:DNA helicase UvrD [Candidatus Thiodiazotropha sp. (ex Lucina pensylvanica)]MBT3052910.1 DNA helicase UvrD [Candidatus Thiodiazotropha sp. (ex Codakia orbicularis)]
MTRIVSDAFRVPQGKLPKIEHQAAVDVEGAILGAEIIAYLLQSHSGVADIESFINLICSYYRGKGGDEPSKTALQEAERIWRAYENAQEKLESGKAVAKNSIYLPMAEVFESVHDLDITGNPDQDWNTVRNHLDQTDCKRLNEIGAEVRNIRLLVRGSQLREALSQNWRDTGSYSDALEIVRQAFVQEHFSTNLKPESGVVIMNMHKAKGKQFDEVIIFEGWPRRVRGKIVANPDRIVRANMRENINSQARQNFRVSITRAKRRTTILTPNGDVCALLIPVT